MRYGDLSSCDSVWLAMRERIAVAINGAGPALLNRKGPLATR